MRGSAQSQVGEFQADGFERAVVSACFYDVSDGHVIDSTVQRSLVPASVMKLVTTAAAWEILGRDYRFKTTLGYRGLVNHDRNHLDGDLVIIGGGDPAFYSSYFPDHYADTFSRWIEHLKETGIQSVSGNLVIDLTCMQGQSIPGGWIWEDIGNYYGAGVSAFSYADNQYKIHFWSDKQAGKPAKIIKVEPNIDGFMIENEVLSSDTLRDLAYVYGAPGGHSVVVAGTIPKGRTDFVVKGAMLNPALEASRLFSEKLNEAGIAFEGEILLSAKKPVECTKIICQKSSPSLAELIRITNKKSNNLFAEHILRAMGGLNGKGTLKDGLHVIRSFWEHRGINIDGFFQTDGSGLSRSNAICPRTLVEILHYMYQSESGAAFMETLPEAGENGTLTGSFKQGVFANNLCAKTGSMERVRSLAGMFTAEDEHKIIFAIILNNFAASQLKTQKIMEQKLLKLYYSKQ